MNVQLKDSYSPVYLDSGTSVGGSQMWSENPVIRKCGCGAVAAFDVFRYLTRNDPSQPGFREWDQTAYCQELKSLTQHYFPLLYPSGINGLMLVAGLNRLFRHHGLSWRARWVTSGNKLFKRMEQMLSADIPVILAVGPNFPLLWQKHGLLFYHRNRHGVLQTTSRVRGHYVTVLAIHDAWMTVSSWGRKYEVSIPEYKEYVRQYSSTLFSNIVLIEKK